MTFWIAVIGGIILGLWVCFENRETKNNRNNHRSNRNRSFGDSAPKTFTSGPSRTAGKYQIKSDDDGYSRVIDKSTGACVYESPNKSDATDWKRNHE